MVTNHIPVAQTTLIRITVTTKKYHGLVGLEMAHTHRAKTTPNNSPRPTTKRSIPAFSIRSHLANRSVGVATESLSFMSNNKVSDRSQPPLSLDLSLSEPAGSG